LPARSGLPQSLRQPEQRQNDGLLEARVQSFELAYRMQMEADDAFDLALSDFDFWRATGGVTFRF